MRWSCPHCNANVSVSDQKVGGNAWFYARCFRCNGHSLVRRAEVNLIKVDRTPRGERVLQTEAANMDPPLLGQEATQKLAQYIKAGNTPQVIETPKPAAHQPPPSGSARYASRTSYRGTPPQPQPLQARATPAPLAPSTQATQIAQVAPELLMRREPGILQKILPFIISGAGILVVASGTYFYLQATAILRHSIPGSSHRAIDEDHLARHASAPQPFAITRGPNPAPTAPAAPTPSRHTHSAASATPEHAPSPEHASAPAPTTAPATSAAREPASSKPKTSPSSAQATTAQAIAAIDARSTTASTTASTSSSSARQMWIKIRSEGANLFSGPGLSFPIIGTAGSEHRFAVLEWNDRWFKIRVPEPADPKNPSPAASKVGWVRNDLVQFVQ